MTGAHFLLHKFCSLGHPLVVAFWHLQDQTKVHNLYRFACWTPISAVRQKVLDPYECTKQPDAAIVHTGAFFRFPKYPNITNRGIHPVGTSRKSHATRIWDRKWFKTGCILLQEDQKLSFSPVFLSTFPETNRTVS